MARVNKFGKSVVRRGLNNFRSTKSDAGPPGSLASNPFWLGRPVASATIIFVILALFLTACVGSCAQRRMVVSIPAEAGLQVAGLGLAGPDPGRSR